MNRTMIVESAAVVLGVVGASVSFAQLSNQKCNPTTECTSGCTCPVQGTCGSGQDGCVVQDFCAGQLPKPTPGMYNEVDCGYAPTYTCQPADPGEGINDCGGVFRCKPTSHCGWCQYVSGPCEYFPTCDASLVSVDYDKRRGEAVHVFTVQPATEGVAGTTQVEFGINDSPFRAKLSVRVVAGNASK